MVNTAWHSKMLVGSTMTRVPFRGCYHSSNLAIRQLKFELPHAPMYPDLAPSDYYMFGPLAEAFRG